MQLHISTSTLRAGWGLQSRHSAIRHRATGGMPPSGAEPMNPSQHGAQFGSPAMLDNSASTMYQLWVSNVTLQESRPSSAYGIGALSPTPSFVDGALVGCLSHPMDPCPPVQDQIPCWPLSPSTTLQLLGFEGGLKTPASSAQDTDLTAPANYDPGEGCGLL